MYENLIIFLIQMEDSTTDVEITLSMTEEDL